MIGAAQSKSFSEHKVINSSNNYITWASQSEVYVGTIITLRTGTSNGTSVLTVAGGRKNGLISFMKCLSPKVISVELLTATLPILAVATADGVVPKLCALPSSSPMMLRRVFKLLTGSFLLAIAVESVEIEQLLVELSGITAVAFTTSRMVSCNNQPPCYDILFSSNNINLYMFTLTLDIFPPCCCNEMHMILQSLKY
uniref:Uncharacterized protein n=1 Tax=Glossina palpalis gambiensis TaxID=67801 RepID=A0A1B0B175_9MUSC